MTLSVCYRTCPSLSILAALLLSGCLSASPTKTTTTKSTTGIKGACKLSADCRSGLTCDTSTYTCQPAGTTIQDAPCMLSAECMPGFFCTQDPIGGRCAPAGTGVAGVVCSDDSQCVSQLMCARQGASGVCAQPGAGDLAAACTQPTDCMAGLLCLSGTCQKTVPLTTGAGLTCDKTEAATATALFHVPRAGEPVSKDFYQLPFPNDIRRKNGRISMAAHPRPGAGLLPFDIVDRYIRAIEQDSTGFGVNQAAYFRFSRVPNFDNLPPGTVAIVNITSSSPEYGQGSSLWWTGSDGGTPYICDRFMSIRPGFGNPLLPGTTYAAMVRRTLTDKSGSSFNPDSDFVAMLADAAPGDPDLAAAWNAYAPLRGYLADAKLPDRPSPADLAVAAVFTTERVEDPLTAIHAAIGAGPAPALGDFKRCNDPGAVSPCDDGLTGAKHTRGCFPERLAGVSFDEYQGTVNLPVFQQGTPPYLNPEDGGGILLAGDGTAQIVRTQAVCVSLTVPHGTAPATGWPLVVYSHGTGGAYNSTVDLGLAEDYAKGAAPGGAAVPMATLGYEGILHGNRKGNSTKDVGELVYNFMNPRAARDNALQAAADLIAIPRAFPDLATRYKIDPTHVALYGHSQGGNAASLALAVESSYGAAVMSGTGGTLIFTILKKRQPVYVGALLSMLLGEASVGSDHPVLNLMQMYFDRSDSVTFGRRLFHKPLKGITPRHALHVYGTDDSYAPVETQLTYAQAVEFPVALPLAETDPSRVSTLNAMGTLTPPVKADVSFGGQTLVTAGQIQYQPDGTYDGHFVSTNHPSARAAIQTFLVTFVRDDAPTIVR